MLYFKTLSDGALVCRENHAEAIDQWHSHEFHEAGELYWDNLLHTLLQAANKSRDDIASDPKAAPWKVMIAYYLRTHTAVTNGWISATSSEQTY